MRKIKPQSWFTSKKNLSSEQFAFQALLNLLPYPALAVDINQDTISHANQKAVELTGFTHSELCLRSLSQILDKDQLQKFLDASSGIQSARLIRNRGTVVDVYLELHSLGAEASYHILKIEPVKERDRQERQLLQQQRYSTRMAGFLTALQESDHHLALQHVLEATLRLLDADTVGFYQASGDHPGATLRISLGKHTELLPVEIKALDLALLKEPVAWNTRRAHRPEIHRRLRSAGYLGLLTAPLGTPKALTGALIAFSQDEFSPESSGLLQESALIAEIISDQHARLNNLIPKAHHPMPLLDQHHLIWNLMSDSLVMLDKQLFVKNINQAAMNSLGYENNEAIGIRAEDLFISDTLLEPVFNQIRQGHIAPTIMTARLFRRGGGVVHATLHFLPLSTDGLLDRVVVIFQDQSEHEQVKQRNEQLEQRALLGEVTASFAHEVRNPINNISTGLQVLQMSLPSDDPNQANIQRLQQDCIRLNELIKTGLAFIKPLEYSIERIDINSLLQNLLERWQHRLKRDNITLVFQPEPTPPLIEGDLRAVEQIFNNLFTNAVQAMKAQPANDVPFVLGVKVRRVGQVGSNDQIEIGVSDTGVGIAEQTRDHIFEPFFTTKPSGTGLGLAIVKRIITAHKGSIQLSSFPGATVFTVRFPAA
jgi:PAS domain S-box-containing protein